MMMVGMPGAPRRRAVQQPGRYALSVAVTAIVTGLLVGCAALGRATFQEPVVSLRSVAVTGLSFTGGAMEVELQVANPNRFALDAPGLRYRVDVDAVQVAAGELEAPFRVAGRDSAVVRLPLQFTFRGLGAAGRSLLLSGTVPYRVRGALTVSTPIGTFTHPFDRVGQYSGAPRR
ncbi:MAG: LEA type 2 family protein [Gemmatimonadetes bacterium]|nr:LEA type 2 family protein [Gemmatimonadota bacterium]